MGYGKIGDGKGGWVLAHRTALELLGGKRIPKGLKALHHCDNPPCCNPKHLYAGTSLQNNRDRELRGRGNHARGTKVNTARLTEAKVRRVFTSKHTSQITADKFGIAQSTVCRIWNRVYWKHVTKNLSR